MVHCPCADYTHYISPPLIFTRHPPPIFHRIFGIGNRPIPSSPSFCRGPSQSHGFWFAFCSFGIGRRGIPIFDFGYYLGLLIFSRAPDSNVYHDTLMQPHFCHLLNICMFFYWLVPLPFFANFYILVGK